MKDDPGRCEVVVFARAPLPGKVKTRLAATLGAVQAADVYRTLLDHTVKEALGTLLPVTVSLAEAGETGGWVPPPRVALTFQQGGTPGERMANAFAERFAAGAEAVILVRSDSPRLTRGTILHAAELCREFPVVVVPTVDRGYSLIAQHTPGAAIFAGIPWAAPATMTATRARLRRLGLEWHELPEVDDVRTLSDLEQAVADPDVDETLRRRLQAAASFPLRF